jgi:hypothetical protein
MLTYGSAHTPVYTFFADSLRGRDTIAAFGKQHKRLFARANERLVRQLAAATFANQVVLSLLAFASIKVRVLMYQRIQCVGKWAQQLTYADVC